MSKRKQKFATFGLVACALLGASLTNRDSQTADSPTTNSQTKPINIVPGDIRLCQALGPAAPGPTWGVDSAAGCGEEVGWDARGCIPFQAFAQGEYVGHHRTPHVPEYRLRVGDRVAFVYRRTRQELSRPYEIQVGDQIQIDSLTAGQGNNTSSRSGDGSSPSNDGLNRTLTVQPEGTITLPLLGQIRATRRSVDSLRQELEERYKKFYKLPSITVTPIRMNTKLEDLLDTIGTNFTSGGRQYEATVSPAGMVNLIGIGMVHVQGLTPVEVEMEINARYDAFIPGVHVTLNVLQRAARFAYVIGEVDQAGRFELQGPTTVIQALALAGGANVGANLRQVVVLRRADDWRMMATMVDVQGALYARRPVPVDDIWLNDSDIIIVPKTPIQIADEIIDQIFTRGVYQVIPREFLFDLNFSSNSST